MINLLYEKITFLQFDLHVDMLVKRGSSRESSVL